MYMYNPDPRINTKFKIITHRERPKVILPRATTMLPADAASSQSTISADLSTDSEQSFGDDDALVWYKEGDEFDRDQEKRREKREAARAAQGFRTKKRKRKQKAKKKKSKKKKSKKKGKSKKKKKGTRSK